MQPAHRAPHQGNRRLHCRCRNARRRVSVQRHSNRLVKLHRDTQSSARHHIRRPTKPRPTAMQNCRPVSPSADQTPPSASHERKHALRRSGRATHQPPDGVRPLKPSQANEDTRPPLPAFNRPLGRSQVPKGRKQQHSKGSEPHPRLSPAETQPSCDASRHRPTGRPEFIK